MIVRRGSFGLKRLRKVPLTFEEHDALGAELQAMRDRLGEIATMLSSRYPKCSSDYDVAAKAQRWVDRLRSRLDVRFGHDCPEHDCGMASKVYYRGGAR